MLSNALIAPASTRSTSARSAFAPASTLALAAMLNAALFAVRQPPAQAGRIFSGLRRHSPPDPCSNAADNHRDDRSEAEMSKPRGECVRNCECLRIQPAAALELRPGRYVFGLRRSD